MEFNGNRSERTEKWMDMQHMTKESSVKMYSLATVS